MNENKKGWKRDEKKTVILSAFLFSRYAWDIILSLRNIICMYLSGSLVLFVFTILYSHPSLKRRMDGYIYMCRETNGGLNPHTLHNTQINQLTLSHVQSILFRFIIIPTDKRQCLLCI